MKYCIIGADGKTYGPVELEQIRQWLAEGRADGRSPVYVEGASQWTHLGSLPELAAQFASPPPAIGPVTLGTTSVRGTNGFATAGLICGLLSWTSCCCFCCAPVNLLGLIFSIVALVQISSQARPQEGRLFAIIGLILSAASLFFGLAAALWQLATNSATVSWQMNGF